MLKVYCVHGIVVLMIIFSCSGLHVDCYDVFKASDKKVANMPLFIFVPLEEGTRLLVVGGEISIPVGTMLVTSQDFWHGGAAYVEDNLRLFFKVNYCGDSNTLLKSGGETGSYTLQDQLFIPVGERENVQHFIEKLRKTERKRDMDEKE